MKLFYDALLRTILATLLSGVVWILFFTFPGPSLSVITFDILLFAFPVFIAMLSFNIVKAHIGNQASRKSK